MATSRIPRGYERNSNLVRQFLEIKEAIRPAIQLKPAQYLPVSNEDNYLNDWVVINAGTIVAVDPSGDLVNCNGGASQTLTYTSKDVGLTIDFDSNGHDQYVAGAKTTSNKVAGNAPVGVAPYDYFQNINAGFDNANPTQQTKYTNYQIQDKVAVLCDYMIEVPCTSGVDASGVIKVGDLVQSDANGNFIKWQNGRDDVKQIVGRVMQRINVVAVDNLNLVQTVPGLGLSGSETGGIPQHLYNYANATAYAQKMLINIMVA
jgi:hypothetical protein